MNEKAEKVGDSEAEVWNAISAFEQILDAIPNDRVALETLYDAYEKIGDHAQSLSYLLRLGNVVAEEADIDAAVGLLEKIEPRIGDNEEAKKTAQALKELAAKRPKAAPKKTPAAKKKTARRPIDITGEMALAWNLLQAEEITQDDYNSIVADLTETSSRQVDSPVSVMHVLADRQFKNTNKVLVHLSKQSGFPIISLSTFEVEEDVLQLLPSDFMLQRGAIVFDRMAKDLLVAILNPFDTKLQEQVAEVTGMNCHFYIVTATEYDEVLRNVREAAAKDAKDAAAKA